MNIEAIHTFLELARLGSFSRVAEQTCLTQSTVSARIKVLEDYLDCKLFERAPSGVSLAPAGKRFHRYALSIQQLWGQGRQEVRLPAGYNESAGIGIHMTMWRQFMPGWLIWMRDNYPQFALRAEADYSERLTEYLMQGTLDLVVTHMPKVVPNLVVETFTVDQLVMVSSEPMDLASCQNSNYIYVDWSYGYREEHVEKLPELPTSSFNVGYGEIALEYLLHHSGFAYLPLSLISDFIKDGRLHLVTNAPTLQRPSFVIYPEVPTNARATAVAIEGLHSQL